MAATEVIRFLFPAQIGIGSPNPISAPVEINISAPSWRLAIFCVSNRRTDGISPFFASEGFGA
jgi:hypothetical protein